MTYILRIPGRKPNYTLTEQLHVTFYRRRRDTGRMIGDMFREVEDAGADENVLQVFPATQQEIKAVSSHGRTPQRYWHVFRRRLADMHKQVCVITPKAERQIQQYDEQIAYHQSMIANLRNQRHEAVQQAWRTAKSASLGELTQQAQEREQAKVGS